MHFRYGDAYLKIEPLNILSMIEHIINGVLIRMVLKKLKNIVKTVAGKRRLKSEAIKEMTNWLHDLEFLIIKAMILVITVHHLYAYTLKTMF
jgi:hypothetical protein